MTIQDLPGLNASLNGSAAVLALIGYLCIKNKNRAWHRALMLAALVASVGFLTSYLIYHFSIAQVTKYPGDGLGKVIYYAILITHVPLAALIAPLLLRAVFLAMKDRIPAHKKLVRWVFPLWMYVSATGVLIYFMLYRWA